MPEQVQLSDELRFTVALVSKIAALNPPDSLRVGLIDPDDEDKDLVVDWWGPVASAWFQDVCAHLAIHPQNLPPEPSLEDATTLSAVLRPDQRDSVVSALLTATIMPNSKAKEDINNQSSQLKAAETAAKAFGYSAGSRAVLIRTLELMSIPTINLLEVEKNLGRDLFHQLREEEMKEKSEAARKEQEHGWGGKWGRWVATGGGVILGGVAIGLTGGLAAPALVPLLPFLTASTAPIVLGSLFGIAGGGLAGQRVRTRWGGVEYFEFEQISGGDEHSRQRQQASYAVYNRKKRGSQAENMPDEKSVGSEGGGPVPPSLVATICIPGITLGSEDEGLNAFKDALGLLAHPIRDVFVLKHSPDVMLSTGETLNTWIRTKLLTTVGKEILAKTVFNAVLAAIALPSTIYSTTGLALDNDWIRACDKAKKAGDLLAEVLKERIQGERPVTLVASSLGALALFRALLKLADSDQLSEPIIDTVILISLPQVVSAQEWAMARMVVSRRIVNAYSSRDFVLAGVGRLHEVVSGGGFGGMAGLNAVKIHGIEDIDISEIVGGHFDINSNMTKVLAMAKVND
ncbi:membrane protein [Ceratobasidium sp. AG-Ba]|nr:membrane protein [Ceratobasidium sp. AG-Ba]